MKKKFLCLLLSLAACGTMALGAVGCNKKEVFYFEQDEEQEDEQDISSPLKFSLNSDGQSYCVTGIEKTVEEDIVIPSLYKKKPVTAIGERAFSYCRTMKSITIPESMKVIGKGAFEGCDRFYAVKIFDIAAWCKIDFNYSVLAYRLYLNDEEVTELEIPDGVKSISGNAFNDCISLESVTIPKSVQKIGTYAFSGCDKLYEIVNLSPVQVSLVGQHDVDIYDHTNFESKIKKQDGFAFYEGEEETYLLDYLGDKTEITLPEKFNGKEYQIVNYALYARENIKSIIISDSVTDIGGNAFWRCENLENFETGNSLTVINQRMFHGDVNLKTISIGKGIKRIFYGAFGECERLQAVKISDLEAWCKIELDNYNSNPLIIAHRLYLNGDEVTKLEIPNGVDRILMYAFKGCTSLQSVTIPDSVTEIGEGAFMDCSNLKSVTIAKNVKKIGREAFENCTALESATFEKTEGWTITKREIIVSDPKTNAENLTSELREFDWKND